MVNLLLIVGAVKRIPNHVFPWLCANAIVIALLMVSFHRLKYNTLFATRHGRIFLFM